MPRFDLINPDTQDTVDDLPTYDRGSYQPHPALPGKLRSETHEVHAGGHASSSGATHSPPANQAQFAPETTDLHRDNSILSSTSGTTHSSGRGGPVHPHHPPQRIGTMPISPLPPVLPHDGAAPIPMLDGPSPPPSAMGRPRPPLTVNIPMGHGATTGIMPVQPVVQPYGAQPQMVYAAPPHLAVGPDPSTFVCHYCGTMQKTKTTPVKGDYTMQMTILVGVFTCLWCLPGRMASCQDVEHSCGNCDRVLSKWQRHDKKVVSAHGQAAASTAVPSYAQEMRPAAIRRS